MSFKMTDQPAFHKSDPVTESERYLGAVCEKSFLSLWTYPGIYRDQGKNTATREGKEVCDLVVVFKNHIILFSDKSCAFSESGNWEIDWNRWYRKAILKSADQLYGAERWFRDFQDRLYLDRPCTQPFPIALPDSADIQFHRIAVARGAGEASRKYFASGSGSLVLVSGWAEQQAKREGLPTPPFAVGDINPMRGYVHVLDDVTLDIVLTTLDTVPDFVSYLEKKERFVRSRSFITAAGEEELLACYLQSWNESGDLDFPYPKTKPLGRYGDTIPMALAEGGWENILQSQDWRALTAWQKVSYYWDFLIEHLSQETITGNLYKTVPDPSPRYQEKLLRVLAAEPRHRRRVLAGRLLGQIRRAPDDIVLDRSARVVPSSGPDEPTYVFVVVGRNQDESHDEYRTRRQELLKAYASVVKHQYQASDDIIAFGVNARDVGDRTEDILYVDAREWTSEMAEWANQLRREGGILKKVMHKHIPFEPRHYLDAKTMRNLGEALANRKVARNEQCPCGSGKKYKRCHGLD